MNKKIKSYIDVLFVDIPRTAKSIKLKEELLSNMNERFNAYRQEGKTEMQSFSLVVANMGDIDELLKDVMPDVDLKNEAKFYRIRNARNTAIAIALIMMGPASIIASVFLGTPILMGVVILLILTAIGACLMTYTNMSTPPEYKDLDTKSNFGQSNFGQSNFGQIHREQTSRGRIFQSIMAIYWSIAVLLYLVISFATGYWHITWII